MSDHFQIIQKAGDRLVDLFHYIALFGIGATIVWSGVRTFSISVSIGPGATAFTVMPCAASSFDRYAVTACTPALEAP